MSNFFDNIGLAPMEGVSDLATRLWLSLTSQPSWAITPFFRITENFPTKRLPQIFAADACDLRKTVPYKVIPQLMGTDPLHLAHIGNYLVSRGALGCDINCGCPAPTVVGSHAGSAILKNPATFQTFLKTLTSHSPPHLWSVKMRLGFHDAHEFDDLWANLQEINIRQVAIHGRTRQQKYLGAAQWDPLYRASLSSSLPIIGSGDITSHSSPHLLYSKTKLAGALVGRGALRNPWIFYEIKNQKKLILTPDIFLNALSVFAGLQHALYTNSHGLFELMERGVFLTPHLNDNSKWQSTLEILMDVLKYPSGINLWPLEHKTLCRVKMIFNYLRFSLPTDHDTTHLLRISKWDHFWNALHQFLFNKLPREFSLNHNPNHDWVFSGAPNPNKVNLNDGINTKKGSSEPH